MATPNRETLNPPRATPKRLLAPPPMTEAANQLSKQWNTPERLARAKAGGASISRPPTQQPPAHRTAENEEQNDQTIRREEAPDGTFYEGQFRGHKRHGKGVWRREDGSVIYDGDWDEGKRHGRGLCIYRAGDVSDAYDGEWRNDKEQGRGIFLSAQGVPWGVGFDKGFGFLGNSRSQFGGTKLPEVDIRCSWVEDSEEKMLGLDEQEPSGAKDEAKEEKGVGGVCGVFGWGGGLVCIVAMWGLQFVVGMILISVLL